MFLRWLIALVVLGIVSGSAEAQNGAPPAPPRTLQYAPAPVDNPLKGLVPYAGDVRDRFPHSLEFNYLPLSDLVTDYDRYDWGPLERLLNDIAGRGHQAVFRIFLEYPGKKNVIPAFLLREGLTVHKWLNTNTQPFPPTEVETPDYENPRLRRVLENFHAALGKKYDGDPRIGFLTAGLLGTWGEWHTYPKDELFASKTVQAEVMDAYEAAFKVTPILLRYPAGSDTYQKAPNASRRFGYHDDSFAWATLETGRPEDNWFFLAALRAAGRGALGKWKTRPIGGEIRPEAWLEVFDPVPASKQVQDLGRCIADTHATWLMDSGLFETRQSPARIERAKSAVRKMGYEFHVSAAAFGAVTNGKLPVAVWLENRGVAPFYYDWPVQFGLIGNGGRLVKTFAGAGKLTNLLPGDKPRVWRETFNLAEFAPGRYTLAVRVPNPLPKGNPVRFANATQDAHRPGWLTLGTFEKRAVTPQRPAAGTRAQRSRS